MDYEDVITKMLSVYFVYLQGKTFNRFMITKFKAEKTKPYNDPLKEIKSKLEIYVF